MVRIGTFNKVEDRKVSEANENQATDKWSNDEGYDVMVRKNKNGYTLLVNDPSGEVYGGAEETAFLGSAETVNRMRGEAANVMREIAYKNFPNEEDEGEGNNEDGEVAAPA